MSLRSSIRNLLAAAFIIVPMLTQPVAQAQIGVGVSIRIAPPALPVYEQPPLPAPGFPAPVIVPRLLRSRACNE